jgi:hypothetical protein
LLVLFHELDARAVVGLIETELGDARDERLDPRRPRRNNKATLADGLVSSQTAACLPPFRSGV